MSLIRQKKLGATYWFEQQGWAAAPLARHEVWEMGAGQSGSLGRAAILSAGVRVSWKDVAGDKSG